MTNSYAELLALLESSEDISKDALIILSSNLLHQTALLNKIGIIYDSQTEGIRIDLSNQQFKLFKTKQELLNSSKENLFLNNSKSISDNSII